MSRAKISVGPPAAYGTSIRTGRVGYACAIAKRETAGSAAQPAVRCKNCLRLGFIIYLPMDQSRHELTGLRYGALATRLVIRFRTGNFDDLRPFIGFIVDEPGEVGGR